MKSRQELWSNRRTPAMDSTKYLQDHFCAFLESQQGKSYLDQLLEWAGDSKAKLCKRLLLDLDDLRCFNSDLLSTLRESPLRLLGCWTDVLREKIEQHMLNKDGHRLIHAAGDQSMNARFMPLSLQLGFTTTLPGIWVSPRDLMANSLGSMVFVQGVVTRCSGVQPRIVRSVHWSEEAQKHIAQEFRDVTEVKTCSSASTDGQFKRGWVPIWTREPAQSAMRSPLNMEGHSLDPEYGLAFFKDHQTLVLQEQPELIPHGQLPRSALAGVFEFA